MTTVDLHSTEPAWSTPVDDALQFGNVGRQRPAGGLGAHLDVVQVQSDKRGRPRPMVDRNLRVDLHIAGLDRELGDEVLVGEIQARGGMQHEVVGELAGVLHGDPPDPPSDPGAGGTVPPSAAAASGTSGVEVPLLPNDEHAPTTPVAKSTARVVALMPPAVEPGQPPIVIITTVRKSVAVVVCA